ncbi:MAG: S1C family serine protease [Massiliimalia sp.]|jgi:serine protease Do
MYNQQQYPTGRQTSNPQYSVPPRTNKKPSRKTPILKKTAALALSAVLFGGIAGGSFFGVNTFLEHIYIAQSSETAQSSDVSFTNVASYSTSTGTDQSLNVSAIAAEGLPSVVSVTNISVQEVQNYFGQFGGRGGHEQVQLQETTSCGSGVIIHSADGYLYMVTNYHVVEGASTLSVTFVDDQTYEAQLCGYDESMDIALLKVSADDLSSDTLSQISVVTIGDSDELTVGEQVVAIGNALGYGQSVTTGIVSALDRTVSTDTTSSTYIQTDAAINPGNSGGALLNMDGELIGINTAKVSSTEVEGMGYAIPISQVLEVIESLMN